MSEAGGVHGRLGLETSGVAGSVRPGDGDRGVQHGEDNDHLALVYRGRDEQFAAVVPFIRRGLDRGERCLYIADDNTRADVLNALREGGVEVDAALAAGDLSVHTAAETYLAGGEFDQEAMLDFWREALAAARGEGGHAGIRAAAEMTWALDGGADLDGLAAYEAALNALYAGEDYVVLCQYNRDRFPSDVVSDVIRTHPLVVSDETACRNTYYRPPEEFLRADRPPLQVERVLRRLRGRGRRAEGRVVPLLGHAGNREVVVEWLAEHYDVVSPARAADVLRDGRTDCVLVDAAGFDRYRSLLIERKDAEAPRALPYLFVHGTEGPPADTELRQYVDEVIEAPVGKRTLAWRLDSLLRVRELSLDLARERERLEQLAEAAAHDLRNPLNVAQGYLEQVDDGPAKRNIARAHDRMEHLIEEVLAIARTAERVDADETEPVALAALVRECWEIVPGDRATLEPRIEDGRVVRAKPILLEQLIDNLVRNAVMHGPEDVTVRVGSLASGDGFYVEDDGPGVPEAERERVFDSGYSTAASSGLGLAVVQRVCDAHGWEVALSESRDGGARFEITGMEVR